MTINVTYRHENKRAPEQIDDVRLISIYPGADYGGALPEIVFHFKHATPQQNCILSTIHSITISE